MRCFIAIFPPKEILDYLYDLENELKKELPAKINWIAKSKLHITLKFLGQLDEKKINIIKERLKIINFKKFCLSLEKIGLFPESNQSSISDKARVLWIGFDGENAVLELQKIIDQTLLDIFSNKQEFRAHMTLGRIKNITDKKKFFDILNNKDINKLKFDINEFKVMKSILRKDGPMYNVLEIYNLR